MCSLAGEVMIEENTINLKKKGLSLDKCKKCLTETPAIILRKTDAYCKSCFLLSTVHKFRATLGKHRIIRPNERVLVVYQTGHASSALLHFIRGGLDLPTHKKLRLEPVVLYIDDHSKLSSEQHFEICKKVRNEITSHKFSGYFTSLQHFIENFDDSPKYIELTEQLETKLIEEVLTNSNKKYTNLTQYEDISEISRRQLIIRMAKQLNCRIVFTTEISVDVAIKMLSNLSLGRGSHMSLDVGVLDDRDPEVKILQPLRYFDMKELAFYNIFNNIEPISIGIEAKQPSAPSVNKLLTKFVTDLQENYPSTVKTVVRTGDKLTCERTDTVCSICKAPIERSTILSSSEARDFSHWISTNTCNKNENIKYDTERNSDDKFCYGCRNISTLIQN